MEPLEQTLKCRRCVATHHDCVVYDGNRKTNSLKAQRYMVTQDSQPQASTSRLPSQSSEVSNHSNPEKSGGSAILEKEVEETDSPLSFWTDEKNASTLPPRLLNGSNNHKSVSYVIEVLRSERVIDQLLLSGLRPF